MAVASMEACWAAQAAGEDLLYPSLLCCQLQKPTGSRALSEEQDDVGWGELLLSAARTPSHGAGLAGMLLKELLNHQRSQSSMWEGTPVSIALWSNAGLQFVVVRMQLGCIPKQENQDWDGWDGGARAGAHLQQRDALLLACHLQSD